MHLISIIIPIYNAEKYLSKCLDSIIAQTYTKLEAILIDDGSPDNCGKICDRYAANDNRFKVIHQLNGGVSVARQTGLDNATGDYIIHCDPDDWIEPTMLEEVLNHAINNNADMVISDYIIEKDGKTEYSKQNLPENPDAKDVISRIINEQLHGSLCNKLVRRECCHGLAFYPTNVYLAEDELFNIRLLAKDIKVTYLPKAFYHYKMDNYSSACQSRNVKIVSSRIITVKEYEKILDKKEYDDFFVIKKRILTTLFLSRNTKGIKNLFNETAARIIKQHNRYNPKLPLGYFLALALKGRPVLAYYLYQINIGTIRFIQFIKRKF